ncbi:hypothetical protein BLOT_001349 [Blomia tropicalis]|nr:hypothetical protein BLOT_001349 [Blomia tropicalis]
MKPIKWNFTNNKNGNWQNFQSNFLIFLRSLFPLTWIRKYYRGFVHCSLSQFHVWLFLFLVVVVIVVYGVQNLVKRSHFIELHFAVRISSSLLYNCTPNDFNKIFMSISTPVDVNHERPDRCLTYLIGLIFKILSSYFELLRISPIIILCWVPVGFLIKKM